MTKAIRPPQSWDYFAASRVAYYEGNTKLGDYYSLLYCAATNYSSVDPFKEQKDYKEPTVRQQEQKRLFNRLGQLSREIANLRGLFHWMTTREQKISINSAIFALQDEYARAQDEMKTISQRIPA